MKQSFLIRSVGVSLKFSNNKAKSTPCSFAAANLLPGGGFAISFLPRS